MEELNKILDTNEWVITYLWADWCKVCEANTPIIDKIIQENPQVKIIKLDVKGNEQLAKDLEFESLPYYAVYHHGQFIGGETGGGENVPTEILTMINEFVIRQTL